MKRRSYLSYIAFLIISLFVVSSCRTINSLSIADAEAAGLYDILDEEASPAPDGNGCRYLFIRLYNPVYKNPFYMSTFLKIGIAAVEVHPLRLSHASLGFDLTDNFFGLTLMPRPMLNDEQCTDAPANEFMKQCKMDKSTQTTYSLTISSAEYDKVKSVIAQYKDAKYSTGKVFKSGFKSIGRKMFHRKKNRGLETALATRKGAAKAAEKMDKKRKFTCSSFVAFVLYNSIDSITEYFDEYKTNLNYVSVTDLAYLPGMTELFSSTWEDYNNAAAMYALEHKEYTPYMTR